MVKDVGHSAHRKSISLVCGTNAHMLTLHYYTSISWIEYLISNQEPSRCSRFSIQVNRAIPKSKIDIYLTGGGHFFIYEWISITK